jgi:hypothetical protein
MSFLIFSFGKYGILSRTLSGAVYSHRPKTAMVSDMGRRQTAVATGSISGLLNGANAGGIASRLLLYKNIWFYINQRRERRRCIVLK